MQAEEIFALEIKDINYVEIPQDNAYFLILNESLEFQIYFCLFIIAFSVFLLYILLISRSIKIIKYEKRLFENDYFLKKKISIIVFVLLIIRVIRIFYFRSYFEQIDLFLYFFIEILKIVDIGLIPFILKEQIKKNLIIPFKKTFILFWFIIFLISAFDIFLEIFYEKFFEVLTFSILNFTCSTILLILFVKNPVRTSNSHNEYNKILIELKENLPAFREIYDYKPRLQKSKSASPKKKPKVSEVKKISDFSLLIKDVFENKKNKKIKNEDIKISPKIFINDITENFFPESLINHTENHIFNTLNDSFENLNINNNTKVTIYPKIEIRFKNNIKLGVEGKNKNYKKNYLSDFENNYRKNQNEIVKKINEKIENKDNITLNNNNPRKISISNLKKKTNKNFVCFNLNKIVNKETDKEREKYYNLNKNKNNSSTNVIFNQKQKLQRKNSDNIQNYNTGNLNLEYINNNNSVNYHLDETKKAILDIAAKFYFVMIVTIRDFQIKKNIKKNIKDFFDLENSVKNEFLYNSSTYYTKKLQDKLPRLKFPKKISNNDIDFVKNYSINFQIFLKSIVNEPCFVTEDVLKFLEINTENMHQIFRNARHNCINNFRFNDDTINNQRLNSLFSESFYEEKDVSEDENDNLNNFYSNLSNTTIDNYYYITRMKKNIMDNSQIKTSESIVINNNTVTSGNNNILSMNNMYYSNNHKFNNFQISKINDINYSTFMNYKIKVDEINIFSNFNNINNIPFNVNSMQSNSHDFNGNQGSYGISSQKNFSNKNSTNNINVINTNINKKNSRRNNNSMINSNTSINNNIAPNQNININININTNLNITNLPIGTQELIQANLNNINSPNLFNYNISLNNNLYQQNNQGILSPKQNQSNQKEFDGELIFNVSYNCISKILKKKFSDFKHLIDIVSEINKNNENIKSLNKLLKSDEIIVNNFLYNLSDSVIQNVFDNIHTTYKNEIFINEFFHDFFDDSFSYSRGLSLISNYYEYSKKFSHFQRLYVDGKILSIKGEVRDDMIFITSDFKTKKFYLMSIWFDLSLQISGFRQEEVFLKYKYKELMEYIYIMRNELGMVKLIWKNFKYEKTRKKDLKIAELDFQLKEIFNNKDFLKKERWLDIFNMNKCYRQIKSQNRVKSSFTSYPHSFITTGRDSLENMTDI